MMSNQKETLRKAGLKATKARVLISKLFSESKLPISALDIKKKMGKKSADLATIYRILDTFLEKGLIQRIAIGDKSRVYELKDRNHHHHIVCQSCGCIEDFDRCNMEKLQNDIIVSSKKFREIKEHSLELYGLCKKCF